MPQTGLCGTLDNTQKEPCVYCKAETSLDIAPACMPPCMPPCMHASCMHACMPFILFLNTNKAVIIIITVIFVAVVVVVIVNVTFL